MVRPSLSILDPASAIFLAALMTSDVFFSGPFPLGRKCGKISDCFWSIANSFNMQEQHPSHGVAVCYRRLFFGQKQERIVNHDTSGKQHQIQSARWCTYVHTQKKHWHHTVPSERRMHYGPLKTGVHILSLPSKNCTMTLPHPPLIVPSPFLQNGEFNSFFLFSTECTTVYAWNLRWIGNTFSLYILSNHHIATVPYALYQNRNSKKNQFKQLWKIY